MIALTVNYQLFENFDSSFPPLIARAHTTQNWNTPLKLTGGKTYSCQSARGPCTFHDWVYYDNTPFQWQDWMANEVTIPNW